MSTQAVTPPDQRSSRALRPGSTVGWAMVIAAAAFFFFTSIPNYFHYDAAHYDYFWPKRWWLIAHMGGGTLALTLGLFQFSERIRRRYAKAHRWMGRLYLAGVLVGSVGASYMGLFVSVERGMGISLEFLTLAWLVTSGMAYAAAVRRQFAAHREWMIRSYVVTFAFVLFRLGARAHLFGSLGGPMQDAMLAWICWAVPLLLTDVILGWRRALGASRG